MGFEQWNLRANPFEPRPLESPEELENLFVGRENEIRKAREILLSPGSRIMVEAEVGVGKTTFVNKTLSEFVREHADFLVVQKTVKLESYYGAEGKWKIAAAIASALKNLKLGGGLKEKLRELIERAKKLEIQGISIGPILVGKKTEPAPMFGLLSHASEELKSSFSELLPELGYKCAVVALNNLDAMPDEFRNGTLNELRDFLYANNISFVLLANTGFYETIQEDLPRWRGFLSVDPISLPPFSANDVAKIIEKRIKFHAVEDKRPVNPVNKDVMDLLCRISNGNVRWTLETLGELALKLIERPSIGDTMTMEMALPILKTRAQQKLNRLTRAEQKLIVHLLKYGESYSTDEDFQEIIGYGQARLSQLFNSLERRGHLSRRGVKRKAYYSPAPDYKILSTGSET